MGKIAFVFAGQGAQYSGMGKSLYESSPAAKTLYDEAEKLRPGTMEQSFLGNDEDLKKTENTQPCLYLVDLASALALEENGISADGVAGFSLGEVAALAYAGAYSHTDGFSVVTKRGECMAEASVGVEAAMCAVLKLDSETVEKTASDFEKLYAVNFNCPGQTVVSGLKTSMDSFAEKIKELGGRALPLNVSGAFHSPFMNSASEKFTEVLSEYEINEPAKPVYANLNGQVYGGEVRDVLAKQMVSPVRWQETVENMIRDGYTTFIEVGAGTTLSGLIKKISKEVRVYNVCDRESLEITVQAVKENA